MNYRILRTTHVSLYGELIQRRLTEIDPDYPQRAYADKLTSLFTLHAIYGNGFSSAMRKLGHEAIEVVYDLDSLQRTWALEHDIPCVGLDWPRAVLLDQIRHYKPDVLYFQGDYPFLGSTIDLKREFPFIKVMAVYSGAMAGSRFNSIPGLDILFAGTPAVCESYRQHQLNAHLVYHGFDDAVCPLLTPVPNAMHDFTFAGSSGFGFGKSHSYRYWFLHALLTRTPLEAWLYEHQPTGPVETTVTINNSSLIENVLSRLRLRFQQGLGEMSIDELSRLESVLRNDDAPKTDELYRLVIETLAAHDPLSATTISEEKMPTHPLAHLHPARCHGPVFGMDMFNLFNHSRLVFHMHGNLVRDSIGAMRMFEVTGVGSCLVTDTAGNMLTLFEPDREVVTYASLDECVEKVKYLIDNEKDRIKIADAGRRRTLQDHTVFNRVRQIDALIQNYLA